MPEPEEVNPYFSGVVVDASTGLIKWSVDCALSDAGRQTLVGVEEFVVEGKYDPATTWFPEGPWPEMRPCILAQVEFDVAADGVSVLQIDIPAGTVILEAVNARQSKPVGISDGVFEFVTSFAGEHLFRIEPTAPYQAQDFKVIAHAV